MELSPVCLSVVAYADLSADPGFIRTRKYDAMAWILSILQRPQGLVLQGGAFEVVETGKWSPVEVRRPLKLCPFGTSASTSSSSVAVDVSRLLLF